MFEQINAKKIKSEEINNSVFTLKKNTPKLINKDNNENTALLLEENENENCFIHSEFTDDSFALICNEFCLNFLKKPKKIDLSYYYFNTNKSIVYLYDMKKTLTGIDVILHLYEQWKSSILDAKYCMDKTDLYSVADSDIHIGVITEDNDVKTRNNNLHEVLYPTPPQANDDFIKHKQAAVRSNLIAKAKVLEGFDEGKVTIRGITYNYDIRTFDDKEHHMFFKDGILISQQDIDGIPIHEECAEI